VRNAAGAMIKFNISHETQAFAVTDINYFFFFKSKIRITYTLYPLNVCYAQNYISLLYSFWFSKPTGYHDPANYPFALE